MDPVLPLCLAAPSGMVEYYRHGTLSLFAALNTKTGEVLGQTVPRHTSVAFVEFLGAIVASQPRQCEIHVILDNLSTHKTRAVDALEAHPNVHLHSRQHVWLNQVSGSAHRARTPERGIFTLQDGAQIVLYCITMMCETLVEVLDRDAGDVKH